MLGASVRFPGSLACQTAAIVLAPPVPPVRSSAATRSRAVYLDGPAARRTVAPRQRYRRSVCHGPTTELGSRARYVGLSDSGPRIPSLVAIGLRFPGDGDG